MFNIGPLERFDDGQSDYVERLKKSFTAGAPLIPSLEPYCQTGRQAESYHIPIREGIPDCFRHPRLFPNVLLERILEELGLNTFFSSYKGFTKLEYDVYGFAKLLFAYYGQGAELIRANGAAVRSKRRKPSYVT